MRQSLKDHRPLSISIFVLIAVYLLGAILIWQIEKRYTIEKRNNILEVVVSHANLIEWQFSRSLSATYTLATMLRLYGELQNFSMLADHIIANYGGISSLQLAPQGIVSQIYPLKGNEKAIGHNLLKDPTRSTEALKAIKDRKLTLAGPYKLIQGGEAVIGRLPVFFAKKDGSDKFWGFTIVLIRMPKLLKATQVSTLVEKGYNYELSRIDPDSGKRLVFYRSKEDPLVSPVSFTFNVPNGKWTLSISPKSGWHLGLHFYFFICIVGVVGIAFAFLSFVLMRRSEEIKVQSIELKSSNKELQMALSEIKRLSGLLPICSNCKKIRDDKGYWNEIENYIRKHSEAQFSHGICPECLEKLYGEEDWYQKYKQV